MPLGIPVSLVFLPNSSILNSLRKIGIRWNLLTVNSVLVTCRNLLKLFLGFLTNTIEK